MTGVHKKDESLCERSMNMVVSIVKLSSFSIAKMTLGGRTHGSQAPVRILMPKETESPGRANPRNVLRSQEPQGSSKNVSYLIEPDKGIGSNFVSHDKEDVDSKASEFINRVHWGNVDGMATDYIDRVHRKNRHTIREDSPIILPPPPHVTK